MKTILRIIYTVFITFMFYGCKNKTENSPTIYAPSFEADEIKFHYNQFIYFAQSLNKNTSYNETYFYYDWKSNFSTNVSMGICTIENKEDAIATRKISKIYINGSYWESATFVQKRILIFQKMGECNLFKSSNSDMTTISATLLPKSLMHPNATSLLNHDQFHINVNYYIAELFQ